MDDSTIQPTKTYNLKSPKVWLSILLIAIGVILALCFPFFAIFVFSNLGQKGYLFWIFLVAVVLWMTLNYFFGRAIIQLQHAQYSDFARRALRLLLILHGSIIVASMLLVFLSSSLAPVPALMLAGLSCLPTLLIGFIPTYIAVGHYSKKFSQKIPVGEQEQSFIQHNLPKSAYTRPSIVAIILSSILSLILLFAPPHNLFLLYLMMVGPLLIVPWLICNYYCGLAIAKFNYQSIVSTQSARTAYGALFGFQFLLLAVDIILFGILNGDSSFNVKECFDGCNTLNLFALIPNYVIASAIGFIPAYVAIRRYSQWVINYHISAPTKKKDTEVQA